MDFKVKRGSLTVLVLLSILAVLVYADSDSLTVTTDVSNYEPSVTSCVTSAASYNPTENGTTVVVVSFNASDVNGVDDLNDTLAKVEFDDNDTAFVALYESATNTSCATTDINTTMRQYTCSVPMLHWHQHSVNYSARCFSGDKNDSVLATSDSIDAFDYTKLIASWSDGTAVGFTITTFNTNVSDSNSPVNITNTGNAALTNVSITGANLTQSGRPDIDVGLFLIDDDNGVDGGQVLTTSMQQITGVSVPVTTSSIVGTDALWIWFSVPSTLESGSYSGTWTLWEAE